MAIINKSAKKILLREVRQILEATVQVQDQWAKKRRQKGYAPYPSLVEKISEKDYCLYDETGYLASDIKYTIATTSWLKDVTIVYGCTRIVMIFKSGKFKNFVVKIPYGTTYDYCRGEVENYKKAPDEIKPFLAHTEFLGSVAVCSYTISKTVTLPVYIARRVDDGVRLKSVPFTKEEKVPLRKSCRLTNITK